MRSLTSQLEQLPHRLGRAPSYIAVTLLEVFAVLLVWASFARAASNVQTFALSDTKELVLLNVKADGAEYQGRKAVRLTKDSEKDGYALLRGADFQDGAIEADCVFCGNHYRFTSRELAELTGEDEPGALSLH